MIFDIKRYAIHDGPGIRTTVFLKGCPLNCRWCHNPEGKAQKQEFMWWEGRCIGCQSCQSVCAQGAISFSDDSLILDQDKCDACKVCVDACNPRALELIGEEMTVAQVMKEIERDEVFYDESGGGVTLSGGEPLMQPDFSQDILKSCKELMIHTTLDTCGYVQSDLFSRICEHVDLVLYDLKVVDDKKHMALTGVSNEIIVANLKELSRSGRNYIVRFPVVPGANDDEKDILEFGELVSSLSNVNSVSILPYHNAGDEKSRRLVNSRTSSFFGHPSTSEQMVEIEEKLKALGLKVQTGA
ncbi:MAG: glycyl-radical enzyme activating protein [Gemmatimonadota bacterium]|nr:MAG: glycyl-radical enzyme activating protein [Gemmatimonadota bacterium]